MVTFQYSYLRMMSSLYGIEKFSKLYLLHARDFFVHMKFEKALDDKKI